MDWKRPRALRFGVRLLYAVVLGVLVVRPGVADAQSAALVQRLPEPADPLEPWTLEPRGFVPVAPFPSAGASPDTTALLLPGATRSVPLPGDDELVLLIVCRQVLISQPERAELLQQLLQVGVPLQEATRTLGIVDFVEIVREYAIDEVHPDVRAQILALPDSAWSTARPWRGRFAFFQILGREVRARGTLPRLGEGLGDQERARLSRLQRLPDTPQTQAPQPGQDYEPAQVVEQKQPDYPPAATETGEVVLVVEVGRGNSVLGVTVESSTDPIFEGPAIDAARASTYRAAQRGQVPEPGTVRLTYRFAAPNTQQ
jgi:hypothetical protein